VSIWVLPCLGIDAHAVNNSKLIARIMVPPTLRVQARIFYKWGPINPPNDAFSLSPFSPSTVPSPFQSHQMSLLRVVVIALASLFLFAGFAVAGKEEHPDDKDHKDHKDHHHKIYAPKCHDDKWKWVCILSFLSFIPWLLSDLLALCLDIQFYRSTPVQGRFVPAVNVPWWLWVAFVFLFCVCENCRLISFAAFSFPPLAWGGTYGDASKTDLCECNTVVYSLLSACEACQGGKWP
jgi:hypothetical protein